MVDFSSVHLLPHLFGHLSQRTLYISNNVNTNHYHLQCKRYNEMGAGLNGTYWGKESDPLQLDPLQLIESGVYQGFELPPEVKSAGGD